MKKTFWIMGTWLLLVSNVLMTFSNVTFSKNNFDTYTETNWCYVYKHNYQAYLTEYVWWGESYLWSELVSYKCDAEWWTVDLRDAPLESGQRITTIWANAFSWTNVTKVIMPSTVEYIWYGAFCNVKRVWEPVCWNWIIEHWEDCDNIFIRWVNETSICNNECKEVPAPVCWNGVREQYENCFNCQIDVEADGWNCTKSIETSDSIEFQESELLLKASLPIWEYDDSDSVVVGFPDWMNDEFDIEDLDYACAKLQEYTITFVTEDGIDLWTWWTYNQYLNPRDIPDAPEKEWFIWTWYLWNEIFDVNNQITDDITLVYKYEKWWIEYDEENWWIKVSLWDQEIIIKDKNQGAEKSVNEVDTGNSSDFINAIWTYYLWWNNTWLDSSEIFDDNGLVDLDDVNLPEWFDHGYLWLEWWDDWTMWSNDTPCNVDSWEYLPSPDEWKNLMQLWWKINGYELYHDDDWYFFNDMGMIYPDTWKWEKSLNVFVDAGFGGSESPVQVPGSVQYPNSIKKFLSDLYIWWIPPLYVEDWLVDFVDDLLLFPSSLGNWNVWYLIRNWFYLLDELTLNNWYVNSLATPVRCFVKPQFEVSFEVNGWTHVVTQKIFSWDKVAEPEVQKENAEFLWWFTEDWTKFRFDTPITSDITLYAKWQEKKSNNGYSGWWGGGSSSSSGVKDSDKSHNSADDKVTSVSEEKVNSNSEEKVGNNQQNNEVVDSQNQLESVASHKVTYVPDRSLSENEQAYDFAHTYWITTKTSVESAEMNKPLTRIQMAKMLSNYAMNVMWRKPDISKWTVKFNDVTNKMDKSYDNDVTLSYQLWIMWQNMPNNNFRPNDEVTRAEFVSAFSRMLYNTSDGEYRSTSKYYIHHMEKLKWEWIVTNDNPNMKEKRWYVMLMLLRSVK